MHDEMVAYGERLADGVAACSPLLHAALLPVRVLVSLLPKPQLARPGVQALFGAPNEVSVKRWVWWVRFLLFLLRRHGPSFCP